MIDNSTIGNAATIHQVNSFIGELFNAGSISIFLIIVLLSFLSPLSAWHIIFAIVYFVYFVMWAILSETYIFKIIDKGESILINYYVRDKLHDIRIEKNN